MNRRRWCAWVVALAAQAAGVSAAVVVETVDSAALRDAGLEAGDEVLAWRWPVDTPAYRGDVESVFDWRWAALELAPRGDVRLFIRRAGVVRHVDVGIGEWLATVRPSIAVAEMGRVEAARAVTGDDAVATWRRLAERADTPDVRVWALIEAGGVHLRARDWQAALAVFRDAAKQVRSPRAALAVQLELADTLRRLGDFPEAIDIFTRMPAVCERAGEPSQLCANLAHTRVGLTSLQAGELDAAVAAHTPALAVQRRLAPDSPRMARTLHDLGAIAHDRGDLELAASRYERSLGIWQRHAPTGPDASMLLQDLGVIAYERGELGRAQTFWLRTREVLEARGHSVTTLGLVQLNLAAVAIERGDLARGEAVLLDLVDTFREQKVGELFAARALGNLAAVALYRDDPERASALLEESLAIIEQVGGDDRQRGTVLVALARALLAAEEIDRAAVAAQRGLEAKLRVATESREVAESLFVLGEVAWRAGNVDTALEHWRRAAAMQDRWVPGGLDRARTHQAVGRAAIVRGDRSAAVAELSRALEIHQRLVPSTLAAAESFYLLGKAVRETRPERAASYFENASAALETQIGRLGGTLRQRTRYRSDRLELFHEYVALLVELGRIETAFAVLERSRARGFLELLSSRELSFDHVPAELDQRRRRLAGQYERLQERLAAAEEETAYGSLRARLDAVRADYETTLEAIREAAPANAALRRPRIFDVAEVRAALDRGTLMLSFMVGEQASLVFVLDRDRPLEAVRLDVREADLNDRVTRFRELIVDARAGSLAAAGRRTLRARLGRQLFEGLLAPVAARIDEAERLLILPDGVLHLLPWAALERPAEPGFVVAWKPIHLALSATVYGTLRGSTGNQSDPVAAGATRLEAFADPLLTGTGVDVEMASLQRRGVELSPLPASRREVETIAALFGPAEVAIYFGAAASETRVKSLPRRTVADRRFLHFATHTTVDEVAPLDSAVVLSPPATLRPGYDNGLLQAWEIFEQLRIDADLVTLSSCSSALGRGLRGEGLIGLTRAFQFAGAETVAATLWDVGDAATESLMVLFYRHLAAGVPFARALREAQLERLAAGAEPADWAAFQLYGDWR